MIALRRAIALCPQHVNARSGLGVLLLMRGDFGEGFDEYEWRLRSSEVKGPRFRQMPWQGESLAGKHIYIQAEQGFGDTLQFARYLASLAARAGSVTVRVHQQVVTLLRESDLVDKITILEIKSERIRNPAQLANVERELKALQAVADELDRSSLAKPAVALKSINAQLWDVEDDIRECEARADFGAAFIALARAVYRLNDERARLKRVINEISGSRYVEEKSYKGAAGRE